MSSSVGPYLLLDQPIEVNADRLQKSIRVANRGDRAIQVGSHFHFFESNRALWFDREATFGFRLDIPAGTAVRFEPGETREIALVAIGGTRSVYGLNNLTNGDLDDRDVRQRAVAEARRRGFGDVPSQARPSVHEDVRGSD